MKHIELSGFGINCKTALIKTLYRAIPLSLPIYSDSDIISDMYERSWASWEPEDRCRFRYHQIESMYKTFGKSYHLLIDRGIVDQIVFAIMIDKGILPRTNWLPDEELKEDYSFILDYLPYEKKYDFNRFFIYTENRQLIQSVLDDEFEKDVERRSYFYKTVDEYMELQNKFFDIYDSLGLEYTRLHVWNNKPIDKSLEFIVKSITVTI